MRGGLLKGTAAVGAIGGATVIAGKALVGSAAKLDLMNTKIDIVFGDEGKRVRSWAKETGSSMGLTSTKTASLAAGFADLLIPMGFAREEASTMAMDVVGLSGALAEWSGGTTTAAEAADVLSKAMLGETDGLKALGISINQADIAAQLAVNGTEKLTGAALAQAKAVATQELIMAKSVDAQTAFAEGSDSLARKQAELGAKFAEVKDQIIIGLTPAIMGAMELFTSIPGPVLIAIGVLAGIAAGIVGIALVLPALTGAIGLLSAAAGILAPLASAAWAAVLGPIGLIAIAVIALGVTLYVFRDEVMDALGKVKEFVRNAIDIIVSNLDRLLFLIPGVGVIFHLFGDKIKVVFEKVVTWIQPALDKIAAFGDEVMKVWNKVNGFLGGLKSMGVGMLESAGIIDEATESFETLENTMLEAIEADYAAEMAVKQFAEAEALAAEKAEDMAIGIEKAKQAMMDAAAEADRISSRQLAKELATEIVRGDDSMMSFSVMADRAARISQIRAKFAEEEKIAHLTKSLMGDTDATRGVDYKFGAADSIAKKMEKMGRGANQKSYAYSRAWDDSLENRQAGINVNFNGVVTDPVAVGEELGNLLKKARQAGGGSVQFAELGANV